jgi:hypothetical protein
MKLRITLFICLLLAFSSYSCVGERGNTGDTGDTYKKTIKRHKFKVPDLYLGYFSEDKKNILLDYLSKSSEWHVFPLHGTVLAYKRTDILCEREVISVIPSRHKNNIIPDLGGDFINLYPEINKLSKQVNSENISNENTEILLKEVKIHQEEIPSNGFVEKGNVNTSLVVNSSSQKLALHTNEYHSDLREFSSTKTSFLNSTSRELKQLANHSNRGDRLTDLSILPYGSMITSSQQIINIKDMGAGYHSISGYINLLQKGFVYLKIIRKDSNEVWISDKEGSNAEYVGWASNINQKFNFCIATKLRGYGNDENPILTEFQLWFKPDDNSSERLVHTKTLLARYGLR